MELERKLSLPRREVMEEILRDPEIAAAMAGPVQPITMETTYFDTPDGSLRKKYWTLRRPASKRRLRHYSQDTLGGPPLPATSGRSAPGRYWKPSPPLCPGAATGTALHRRPSSLSAAPPFSGGAVQLKLPGCLAELALDEGRLFGGGREEPLLELELERKEGDPAAMFLLCDRLCGTFPCGKNPKANFSVPPAWPKVKNRGNGGNCFQNNQGGHEDGKRSFPAGGCGALSRHQAL